MILAEYKFVSNPKNDGKIYDSWEVDKKICGSEEKLLEYLESWA